MEATPTAPGVAPQRPEEATFPPNDGKTPEDRPKDTDTRGTTNNENENAHEEEMVMVPATDGADSNKSDVAGEIGMPTGAGAAFQKTRDFLTMAVSVLLAASACVLGYLPDVLLKGSPYIVGLGLAGIAHVLLFYCIYLRADIRGRRGTSFVHGIAFLSILIILAFILLCSLLRWRRQFSHHKKDDHDNSITETKNEERDEEQPLEQGPASDDTNCDASTEADIERPGAASDMPEQDEEVSTSRVLLSKTKRLGLLVLIPLTIVLLVFTEVAFVYEMPRNSIVPLSSDQNALNPNSRYIPEGCDIQERYDKAVNFFNGSVSADDVMLVYVTRTIPRSVPFVSSSAAAFVADNTIYLPDEDYWCPPVWLLVHEFAHIYQEQTGYSSGPGAPGRYIRKFLDMQSCRSCLYDYGGREGLIMMMQKALVGDEKAGDILRAFGSEQQATIVEHYYDYWGSCGSDDDSSGSSSMAYTTNWTVPVLANTSDINDELERHNTTEEEDDDYVQYYDHISDTEHCDALRFYACQIINC